MPNKGKASPEEKVCIVEQYLLGKVGPSQIISEYGIAESILQMWARLYKTRGSDGLYPGAKNHIYSPELKMKVVQEYLQNGYSFRYLSEKYNISHHSPEESLTELERAQREIKALQEENRLLRLKEEFLKKWRKQKGGDAESSSSRSCLFCRKRAERG